MVDCSPDYFFLQTLLPLSLLLLYQAVFRSLIISFCLDTLDWGGDNQESHHHLPHSRLVLVVEESSQIWRKSVFYRVFRM